MMAQAFSRALAGESSRDLTFNEDTQTFVLTHDDMYRYAKIIAYKVVANIKNGHKLDPDDDPLTYVDCDDYPPWVPEEAEGP